MTDNEDLMDNFRKVFNAGSKRFTFQRQRVLQIFVDHPQGCTIVEVANRLKPEGIGHMTVYRTVKELVSFGLLKWIHDRNGEHRYIACGGAHCHPVVCRVCGHVELFDCEGLGTLQKLISLETGFAVEGHHLEIYGVCPACK